MIKKVIIALIAISSILLYGCNSVDKSTATEIEQTSSSIESTEVQSSNESEVRTETSSESTEETKVRDGSLQSPIKLGDSFSTKFIIPQYSQEESLIYGNTTVKVIEVTPELITAEVSFYSCDNESASIELGKNILCGAYFSTVNDSMQENSLLSDDIYTSNNEYPTYEPIYPSGSTTVYIKNDNAKYLVLHYSLYSEDDDINIPDKSEEQTFSNGETKVLNSYKTWLCLE